LTFLDADDELDLESLENVINEISDYNDNVDIHIAPYIDEHGKYRRLTSREDLALDYLKAPNGKHILHHCWSKIYRKSLLESNRVLFPRRWIIYEDLSFVSKAINVAEVISVGGESFYRYKGAGLLSKKMHTNPSGFYDSCKRYSNLIEDSDLRRARLLLALSYFFHKVYVNIESDPGLVQWYIILAMLSRKEIWESIRVHPCGRKWRLNVPNSWVLSLFLLPWQAVWRRSKI
jgi:hypothetical protein